MASLTRKDTIWLLLALGLLLVWSLRRKQDAPPIKLGDLNLQQGSKTDLPLQESIDEAGAKLRTLLGADSLLGKGTYAAWGDRATLSTGEDACISDAGFLGACSLFERLGLKRTA